jgi:multisubunit Na+/H+ antiporter MnhB subunit
MRGRPILGVISGFLFGISLALTLIVAGVLPLNSILVTLLPLLGIVLGLVLAGWAPFGKGSVDRPSEPEA